MTYAAPGAFAPVFHPESELDTALAAYEVDRPTLFIDVDRVAQQYHALKRGLGFAQIHYAVKANPTREIIERVVAVDRQRAGVVTGVEIGSAAIGQDQTTGEIVVNLELKSTGSRLFDEYADEVYRFPNPNDRLFAIVLDGIVESAPSINAPRFGGQAQISGNFTVEEATNLVTVLKFGSLPLEIREVGFSSISATLGLDFLNQTLLAGAIGIALVFAFMLLYYRVPAIVARRAETTLQMASGPNVSANLDEAAALVGSRVLLDGGTLYVPPGLVIPILPFAVIGELSGEQWLSRTDDNGLLFGLTGGALLAGDDPSAPMDDDRTVRFWRDGDDLARASMASLMGESTVILNGDVTGEGDGV